CHRPAAITHMVKGPVGSQNIKGCTDCRYPFIDQFICEMDGIAIHRRHILFKNLNGPVILKHTPGFL
ncbi:MAG: hypothetical protein ACRCUV_14560, partial [Eubacterium aggregans]